MPNRVRLQGNLYHPITPPGAVKIARPTRWGNPFKVGNVGVPDVATAIELFARHLDDHPALVDRARRELAGRDLACWCKAGQPCHGDVWLRRLNPELVNTSSRES